MTHTPQEVASIAKGLTKAQCKRLNGIAELVGSGKSWASRYGDRSLRTSRASSAVLLGLSLIADDGWGDAFLTPLGLAVRQHLQDNPA